MISLNDVNYVQTKAIITTLMVFTYTGFITKLSCVFSHPRKPVRKSNWGPWPVTSPLTGQYDFLKPCYYALTQEWVHMRFSPLSPAPSKCVGPDDTYAVARLSAFPRRWTSCNLSRRCTHHSLSICSNNERSSPWDFHTHIKQHVITVLELGFLNKIQVHKRFLR